jgi:hypothetical protein
VSQEKKDHEVNLDRRMFLKTAAATFAIAPIATAKAASEAQTTKKT